MTATPGGLIPNYVVTPTSMSSSFDRSPRLDYLCSNISADVGYVSKDLHTTFARRGYTFLISYLLDAISIKYEGAKENNN